MTEQETITALKENKTKGVAYLFLSEQVRDWVHDKLFDKILLVLDSMGNFIPFDDVEEGLINTEDYDNVVFALPDDYEAKEESKGEWVEFEINEGKFSFIPSDVNGLDGVIESWWNWQEFLTVSSKFHLGFTAFGGWQYENDDRWYLAPAVKLQDDEMWNSYVIEESGEATPVIPVKIRFWRESR